MAENLIFVTKNLTSELFLISAMSHLHLPDRFRNVHCYNQGGRSIHCKMEGGTSVHYDIQGGMSVHCDMQGGRSVHCEIQEGMSL